MEEIEHARRKSEFVAVFIILAGCALLLIIFGSGLGFTGFAVSAGSSDGILKETALNAITESEGIIADMIKNNFSITYMNDTLIEAKRVFEQARYAEILRSSTAKETEKKEAESALKLIDWKGITYASVLNYTERIMEREKEAFVVFDSINLAEKDIENYERSGISAKEERGMLKEAKMAFYEDRYEDAKGLLNNVKQSLEKKSAEATTLKALNTAALSFFQRYGIYVLAVLVVLLIIGFISYKRIGKVLLARKINRLKAEEEAVIELIKRTQTERYTKGKMPERIYRTRMIKYGE
ncbi:MAG: hypothetical protein AAB895_03770, partial [Patescibacteria group bacterium]